MLLLAIVALGVPLAISLSARVKAEVQTQAQAQADLVAATAADLLGAGQRPELRTLSHTAATSIRGRIVVVDGNGAVLADSAGPSQIGASYGSRPEIRAALVGRQVQVQRASRTLGQEILATAVPIVRNGRPVGAVRVTQSIGAVHVAVRHAELGLVVIGLIVLALGLLAGAVIAAQVGRPIRRLEQVARRVAQGDLNARAELEGSSEQRSLASSFNDMTRRIVRLIGAQRQFVADASHQLRTPLTGLRLRLDAARATPLTEALAAELGAAIAEVDRLAHTVNELLILSRGGESQSIGAAIDLDDLARSALTRWRRAAEARGLKLVGRHENTGARVWAARPDAEQALDCLLENAVIYSPKGTMVEVVTAPGRIEVRDRGPGIDEDERVAVLERFRRGRAGLAGPPGSGLGLPIAQELARGWKGELTLRPREGGGTVAILSLCARSDEEGALPPLNREPSSVI